jgi:hypothetical protein
VGAAAHFDDYHDTLQAAFNFDVWFDGI